MSKIEKLYRGTLAAWGMLIDFPLPEYFRLQLKHGADALSTEDNELRRSAFNNELEISMIPLIVGRARCRQLMEHLVVCIESKHRALVGAHLIVRSALLRHALRCNSTSERVKLYGHGSASILLVVTYIIVHHPTVLSTPQDFLCLIHGLLKAQG